MYAIRSYYELGWQAQGAEVNAPSLPEARPHQDDFFGETWVYYDQLDFSLPLSGIQAGATLSLRYQGCTEGLCYPPVQASLALTPTAPVQPAETTLASAPQPVTTPATSDDNPLARGGAIRITSYNVCYTKLLRTRIYFTADKPLTLFKYNGFNPEVPDGIDAQYYPIPAVYTIGLNLKL